MKFMCVCCLHFDALASSSFALKVDQNLIKTFSDIRNTTIPQVPEPQFDSRSKLDVLRWAGTLGSTFTVQQQHRQDRGFCLEDTDATKISVCLTLHFELMNTNLTGSIILYASNEINRYLPWNKIHALKNGTFAHQHGLIDL